MPAVRIAAALAATALLTTGCAAATAATPSTAPSTPQAPRCHQPRPAALPHAWGSLSQTDSGAYCLPVGKQIDVFLTAPGDSPAQSARWGQIRSSDAQVLAPTSTGVLTAPLGVTPGIFLGRAPGTAELTSATTTGKPWTVTIVVR